jgi:hypothetical protein
MAGVNIDLQGATNALVDAWIDFDGDGTWQLSEKILDSAALTSGLQTMNFTVPAGAVSGETFARVRVSTLGGLQPTGFSFDGEVEDYQVSVLAAQPLVESIEVNGGDAQRSSVNEVVVTFDREVSAPASAFFIQNLDTLEVVNNLIVNTSVIGDQTVSVITFADGNLSNGGSLVNGRYQLNVLAAQVTSNGNSSAMQSDFAYGDQMTDNFFRKYGDHNGNEIVDLLDFSAFRQSFGKTAGEAGYLGQ